jgi:hypothetical protein
MIMSNLKPLAETVGMGFSPRNSKTKTPLGLHHFVAATTDQMLMTRGGYGGNQNPGVNHNINCVHGMDRTLCEQSPCKDVDWTKYQGNGGRPMFSQFSGGWFYKFCNACANLDFLNLEKRDTLSPIGELVVTSNHNNGCGGKDGKFKRHHVWVDADGDWTKL